MARYIHTAVAFYCYHSPGPKPFFTFIFQLSGWALRHLCALKTRKCRFQTIDL